MIMEINNVDNISINNNDNNNNNNKIAVVKGVVELRLSTIQNISRKKINLNYDDCLARILQMVFPIRRCYCFKHFTT